MHVLITILYILLCYAVGLLGRNRRFRFIGYFILSVLLTPIVGLLFVVASDPKKTKK